MSFRQAKLCDFTTFANVMCDRIAAIHCPLCDRDICAIHAGDPSKHTVTVELHVAKEDPRPSGTPANVDLRAYPAREGQSATICSECFQSCSKLSTSDGRARMGAIARDAHTELLAAIKAEWIAHGLKRR